MASQLELASESRLTPEEVRRAMEGIAAACGGVGRDWYDGLLYFGIEGKEVSVALLPDEYEGKCGIRVGKEAIHVDLDVGEVVVWEGAGWSNFIFFKLPGDVSKVCTALRILASDCEGGNADECRERKVKWLVEEFGLKEVRYRQRGSQSDGEGY